MCILCTMAGRRVEEHVDKPVEYKYSGRLIEAQNAGQTLSEYMKGKKRWGSLHGHSEFSLLDGAAKIEDIINKVRSMGQDFVAITDHGNLFGAVKAAKAAKKAGIKFIVGCELYLTPVGRSRFDKDFKKGERPYHHLVLWAKNRTGYINLCKLSSIGYAEGFYRAPRVDREVLAAHSEGLIATSACVGGSIPMNGVDGDFYKAETDMEWFMKTFGDDFYIELQNHGTELEDRAFTFMREMAQKYRVPTIVTTDSHYLDPEDDLVHDTLLCIGTGQFVRQEDRTFKFEGKGFHYHDQAEVEALFPHDLDAIYRTGEIADKIEDDVIEMGEIKLPNFPIPTGDPEFDAWKARRGELPWLSII